MSEVDGALEVCVVLDGFIDREVTVNLSTVNGTAIGIICISFIWLNLFIRRHCVSKLKIKFYVSVKFML